MDVPLATAEVEEGDEARAAGVRTRRHQPVLTQLRRELSAVLVEQPPVLFGLQGVADALERLLPEAALLPLTEEADRFEVLPSEDKGNADLRVDGGDGRSVCYLLPFIGEELNEMRAHLLIAQLLELFTLLRGEGCKEGGSEDVLKRHCLDPPWVVRARLCVLLPHQ